MSPINTMDTSFWIYSNFAERAVKPVHSILKTTSKLFAPPSAQLKLFPLPPLFVGVKLHLPTPPAVL